MGCFVGVTENRFVNTSARQISTVFGTVASDPLRSINFVLVTMVLNFLIYTLKLRGNIREVAGVVVLSLLIVVLLLTTGDYFLSNDDRKVGFCLLPGVGDVRGIKVNGIVMTTVGRSFFALSLNVNSVTVFNDCLGGGHSLLNRSVGITILSAFITLASNVVVFPTTFTCGVPISSNPGLVFMALPGVFGGLPLNEL